MTKPSNVTVTIDGNKFDAMSTSVGINTSHDSTGMPQMGTLATSIGCTVDVHDTVNMPFATLQALFALANITTTEKIKPIKIEFWQDEQQQNAIATFSFNGWISSFNIDGGDGVNHVLNLRLEPALSEKQFVEISMGN